MTAVHPQAATDPDGPTGRLATWVADLTLDQVPHDVVERAKHLLLDGLGCALVGAQLPWSRVATEAVLGLEGKGDTLVIGTGQVTSAPAAAVLNGTFIQGFELDDFHPLAPLHSCSLLIPALLSTATTRPETTGPTAVPNSCSRRSPASKWARGSGTRCTAPRCWTAAGTRDPSLAPTRRRWRRASCAACRRRNWKTPSAWPAPSRPV